MAGRIRSIKPEVLDDEVAVELSDTAWRLWVSSWCLSDDHGNLRGGNKYLAAEVWKDTSRDVSKPLQDLIDAGFFLPYAVNGQRYLHIVGWEKHQRIDNAGKPRVPRPTEDDGSWAAQTSGLFAYSRGKSRRASAPSAPAAVASSVESSPAVSAETAANRGDSPQVSASDGALPLARSGGETSDHRPPITDPEGPGVPSGRIPDQYVKLQRPYWEQTYCRAVDEARGPKAVAYTFPGVKFSALRSVVDTHCLGDDRKQIDRWIERDVGEFSRAVMRDEPDPKIILDAYSPDRLLAWHNAGKPGHRVRPVLVDPPPPAAPPLTTEQSAENVARVQKLLGGVGR